MDKLLFHKGDEEAKGGFARYILLRVDMELWDLENFVGYLGTITAEYVLRQTPSKDSEWIKIFSASKRVGREAIQLNKTL